MTAANLPDLANIQARADAATGGVWKAWDRGIGYEVHGPDDEPLNFNFRETFTKSDATFIAHARTDVPALLALVQKQQAAIDDLLYIADHKADLTKPVGQWWSEVIRGAIERHMGPIARTVAEEA